MKVQERKQEHLDAFVTEHVVFVITQIENSNSVQKAISSKTDSQIDLTQKCFPTAIRQETRVTDLLELVHPEVPFSYESIRYYKNSLFVFRLKGIGDIVHEVSDEAKTVLLKGAMVFIDDGKYILYMCSVNVTTVRELIERNLHLSDMQRHDGTRDVIMLNQSRMSQVELNRTLEETTKKLKKMAQELEVEKQKTDELLCELMPASVADSLRSGKAMEA
uniref:guanylate cyclase n=1 Tax=Caenorhabditis japonica TaxID=281687 RepID=A0A8R1IT41_CAEJA